MILEIKKQLEDVMRTQQLLKKLPAQKLLPFNSVCYLHVQIPKQEKCIVSLEADYAAEVSLSAADQVLQRRRQRLEESFNLLREHKSYEEMQQDLGNKIDEDLIEKNEKEKQQKEEEKRKQREIQQKKKEEEIIKAKQIEEKMKKEQNIGQVTNLGDDLFEIEEKFVPDDKKIEELNQEQLNLMKLISEAFCADNFDDYQKYSNQLEALNKKISALQPQVEKKQDNKQEVTQQLPPIQEEENVDEQPKKVSKFKQDRMKQKK